MLAATLNKYPKRRIEVYGYTDSAGSDETNLWLSQRRPKRCGRRSSRTASARAASTRAATATPTPSRATPRRRGAHRTGASRSSSDSPPLVFSVDHWQGQARCSMRPGPSHAASRRLWLALEIGLAALVVSLAAFGMSEGIRAATATTTPPASARTATPRARARAARGVRRHRHARRVQSAPDGRRRGTDGLRLWGVGLHGARAMP